MLHEECPLGVTSLILNSGLGDADYATQVMRRLMRLSAATVAVVTSVWPVFAALAPLLPPRKVAKLEMPTDPNKLFTVVKQLESSRRGSWLLLGKEESVFLGGIQRAFHAVHDLPNLIPRLYVDEYFGRCNQTFEFSKPTSPVVHKSIGLATLLAGERCAIWREAVLTIVVQVRNTVGHYPIYILSLCPQEHGRLEMYGHRKAQLCSTSVTGLRRDWSDFRALQCARIYPSQVGCGYCCGEYLSNSLSISTPT